MSELFKWDSGLGGGGGVTDHGDLTGLGDDDHPQYLLTSGKAADSDKLDGIHASGFAAASHNHDHGSLSGLGDNDHPQYRQTSVDIVPGDTDFFTDDKIFSGCIAANGTAIKLPSDWSCSRIATGKYKITHNLGTTNYTFVGTGDNKFVIWVNKNTNTIEAYAAGYASGAMSWYDAKIDFIIIKH